MGKKIITCHVSPKGNDKANGSAAKPLKTG